MAQEIYPKLILDALATVRYPGTGKNVLEMKMVDYDSLGYVKSLDYPIEINGETFYAGGTKEDYENRQKGQHGRADWGWRWSKELFEFGLKNGFVEVHKGGERNRIYTKTYEKVTIDRSGNEYKIVEFDRTKPLSNLEFT